MINKKVKQQVVENLKQIFSTSSIVIVSHNKGLKVTEVRDLRKKVKQLKSQYLVAKNTLVKIALKGSKFSGLDKLMVGPTSLTYSNDPVAIAKVLNDFTKQSEKLEILGGIMDGTFIDVNAVKQLASLPSLDELRAQFIGLLSTPATRIAQITQAPASQIARVLNAYSKK